MIRSGERDVTPRDPKCASAAGSEGVKGHWAWHLGGSTHSIPIMSSVKSEVNKTAAKLVYFGLLYALSQRLLLHPVLCLRKLHSCNSSRSESRRYYQSSSLAQLRIQTECLHHLFVPPQAYLLEEIHLLP